jgi:hypothetical protein
MIFEFVIEPEYLQPPNCLDAGECGSGYTAGREHGSPLSRSGQAGNGITRQGRVFSRRYSVRSVIAATMKRRAESEGTDNRINRFIRASYLH